MIEGIKIRKGKNSKPTRPHKDKKKEYKRNPPKEIL